MMGGWDCSVGRAPPQITRILTVSCTLEDNDCPSELNLQVNNVSTSDAVHCRIRYVHTIDRVDPHVFIVYSTYLHHSCVDGGRTFMNL